MLPTLSHYELSTEVQKELSKIIHPFFESNKDLPRLKIKLDDLTDEIDMTSPFAENIIHGLTNFEVDRLILTANTQRSLNSVIRAYVRFCRGVNIKALPLTPTTCLAYYITMDNEGKSMNTIRLHMAQLTKLATITNTPTPNKTTLIRGFYKTIEERMAEQADPRLSPFQAPAFSANDLSALIKLWKRSDKLVHIRDLATLIIAYATSLREEEICTFRMGDITISENNELKFQRRLSKNKRRDLQAKIINSELSALVIRYLKLLSNHTPDNYFLTGITPKGTSFSECGTKMTSKGINGIFERAYLALNPEMQKQKDHLIIEKGRENVKKRDYDPDRLIYTGHSARIGSVVDSFEVKEELGLSDMDLMKMGDWARIDMVLHYTRHLRAEKTANIKSQQLVKILD